MFISKCQQLLEDDVLVTTKITVARDIVIARALRILHAAASPVARKGDWIKSLWS